MPLAQYLHRVQAIDQLIRQRRTGPPAELAERLGLAQSTLYNYLNFMRRAGAPIAYSKRLKTYYYLFHVEFSFGFQLVGDPEQPG